MGSSILLVKLSLRASSAGGLPWFVGHECRAGFLRMVSQLDPELATLMHEGSGEGGRRRAVFSLKPLSFLSGYELVFPEPRLSRFPVDGNVVFEQGAKAEMSVAILREETASRFVAAVLPKVQGLRIDVKGHLFEVERLEFEVVHTESVLKGETFEEVSLRFETPTYFNPLRGNAKYKVLYPDTTLLFASLVATAHQLTAESYPKPEELAEQVYISGLDIKTPYVKEASHEAPTGFVGWVNLKPKEEADKDVRRTILGLLRLGELTNVGGNRSGGYGVIRAEVDREKNTRKK